jgi:hypothetical protein
MTDVVSNMYITVIMNVSASVLLPFAYECIYFTKAAVQSTATSRRVRVVDSLRADVAGLVEVDAAQVLVVNVLAQPHAEAYHEDLLEVLEAAAKTRQRRAGSESIARRCAVPVDGGGGKCDEGEFEDAAEEELPILYDEVLRVLAQYVRHHHTHYRAGCTDEHMRRRKRSGTKV